VLGLSVEVVHRTPKADTREGRETLGRGMG
jgi:hypothetical protein